MGKTDVSYSRAIILERMGHLQKRNMERVKSYVQLVQSVLSKCLPHTYLIPLVIIPLLKVDSLRGKSLNRFLFLVKQLHLDLIFRATIPPRCVPDETKETGAELYKILNYHFPIRDRNQRKLKVKSV